MAFSQSFEFGNSTFLNLESEAKRAINDNPNEGNLDVIQESPTHSTALNKSRARFDQTKHSNETSSFTRRFENSRRHFRRSKSDSTLPSNYTSKNASNHKATQQTESYSKFFQSDFSISEQEKKTDITEFGTQSVLRVSQIEAAFNENSFEHEDDVENAMSVFEAPVCSEDIRGLLGTETDVNDVSLKSSDVEEVQNLDTSCFVYPNRDVESSQQLAKDLVESRSEMLRIKREENEISRHNNTVNFEKSLSCMSPEQLKWSPAKCSEAQIDPKVVSPIKEVEQAAPSDEKERLKHISAWNLPHSVLCEYEKKGVRKMFDWQIECLSNPKVLFEHCNLVYSAPTSAGKTLVSEILLLKSVLERGKKVLLILPFISVVREKMFYLQDLLTTAGYRVEGFFGGYTPPGGFDSIHVAICTIEKANSIVNKLLEQNKLDEIGTVVVDEVHLISDPGRGYILELLLAKILYMSRKYGLQIQVITMSATLANVELLKRWLSAELYITDFRPVALQEMIKIGNKIYDNKMEYLRDITEPLPGEDYAFPALGNDSDNIAQLCIETLLEGCSVIVFCPSKDWCENLALQLASAIHALGKSGNDYGNRLRTQINRAAIDEVKTQLRDIPTGLDTVLGKTITFGCAFHHAGLTTEERDIVEASFKSGALKVIVATSTLSSGVNLPARRVLIRSPLFGGKQMSSLTYRQMIGRAGRTGKDTLGESILICTESNARIGRELFTADIQPISSCLEMDSSTHLKRALLEIISSGVASSKADVESFVHCTLLSAQKQLNQENKDNSTDENAVDYINEALEFLIEYEFVRLQKNEETEEENYLATRLGLACLASSMPPTDGLILFAELQKSRRCFVIESELHAVYLVTPYSVCYQLQNIDWLLFLDFWEKLTPAMRKVGELVGVKESFLVRAMRGQSNLDYKLLQIHKRFYTALALQELVNETPINIVAQKFKCTRGMLQSLQQMASTFAGIVTAFCTSLQWSTLTLIVSQFKERLYFGIHRDLIDLMRLPDLTHKRARALFDAGITNLVELANSDSFSIEKILFNSLSFDSAKQHEHENIYETEKRNAERNFFITGKAGMTVAEAAKLLVQEARQFVQYEIGVANIKWTQETKDKDEITTETKLEALHMSCEEPQLGTINTKRKSMEDNAKINRMESPPKIKKIETTTENSKKTFSDKLVPKKDSNVEIQNNDKIPLKNSDSRDFKSNELQINRKQSSPKIRKLETVIEKSNHTSSNKLISTKHNALEAQKNNVTPLKIDSSNDPKSIKNEAKKVNLIPQKENGIHKSNSTPNVVVKADAARSDPNQLKNVKSNELNTKVDENLKKTKKSFEQKSVPEQQVLTNEKPSTSAAARRELMKQQIEIRRLEALKRMQEKRGSIETKSHNSKDLQNACSKTPNAASSTKSHNKENICKNTTPSTQFKSPIEKPKSITRRSIERRCLAENIPATANTNSNTPKSNSKTDLNTPKMPRRSPRNHASSTLARTPIINNTKSIEEDLFMDDDSFMLNTGVTAAIVQAEQKSNKNPTKLVDQKSDAVTDDDEIPSSQNMIEHEATAKNSTNAQTPHASRFLRSYQQRTQRFTSPKPVQTTKPPSPKKERNTTAEPTSSTIELSNISMENSLMKNPMQLNASHILSCSKVDIDASSFKSIEIIDICGDLQIFKGAFKELLAAKRFGFSVGVQQQAAKRKPIIGANLLLNQVAAKEQQTKQMLFHLDDCNFITGVAFSIMDNVVYYMNLQEVEEEEFGKQCKHVNTAMKLKYLRLLLGMADVTLLVHEAKEQLKVLRRALPDLSKMLVQLEDPKVSNWLLQPDKTLSFHNMCQQFSPECTGLMELCGSAHRCYGSLGLDSSGTIWAKLRCSVEACVTVHILKGQIENLERIGTGQLHKFFNELEMPIQTSLCNMEIVGFPALESKLQQLFQKMVSTMKKLEQKIYELHGSRFNLGSSAAVAKVVGLHRKSNGRISTSRQILEKIDSPISQLIITYRKLSVTLTKNIQPLLKSVQANRIHGQSITYTSTGRISMIEPNLQNVAKDFDVEIGQEKCTISCRSAFAPADDKCCLISSDFCQLEMRILAHLSQDAALLEVMKSERDIFVAIAARWNKISDDAVSEQLRNGTKQICYGIVYGMGMRSLSEALKCTEQEADLVTRQFHAVYPGIRAYIEKVVKFARNNGYIETITGRRRYLDNINSGEQQMKSQAERQAVNSTIQGSAADIAKSAILRMEKNIIKYREKLGIDEHAVRLVLHLHDELIFEVPSDKAKKIAKVLSLTMENCVKLNVPLKVKLKIGKSWGELREVKV